MMQTHFALPEGRRGQALAVAVALVALALLWNVTAAPLLGWYAAREDELSALTARAAHMRALGQEIPALRAAVDAAGLQKADDQVLLSGDTDVITGANLQTMLQGLAAQAGTSLDSAALQPTQTAGALRRISMQVSVTASWPVLMALFKAVSIAQPRVIIDTLSISTASAESGQAPQLQANFTVTGFRAGSP